MNQAHQAGAHQAGEKPLAVVNRVTSDTMRWKMEAGDGGAGRRYKVQSSCRRQCVEACPFCGRELRLTFHHLIPRKVHRRARFSKHHDRATLNLGIFICRLCHSGIHDCYDEMRLARDFNTPEALGSDPDLQRHFRWVSKQKQQ